MSTRMSMAKLVESVAECPTEKEGIVSGCIPSWLNGSLIRIGPGMWDLPSGFTVNTFFDGAAFMTKYRIDDGACWFQSRFLQSDAYTKMMAHGKTILTEFGTRGHPDPDKGILSRMVNRVIPSELTDNDMINVYSLQDEVYLASESCNIWRIDPNTLDGTKKVNLDKLLKVNISCCHPHTSPNDDTTFNVGTTFLTGLKYHVMKVSSGPNETKSPETDLGSTCFSSGSIFSTVSSSNKTSFSYMHSFWVTDSYIILPELSLKVMAIKLAAITLKGKAMLDALEYDPKDPVRFHIIDKKSGSLLPIKVQSDPFFSLHTINAYEDNDHLVLDIITYPDATLFDKYDLKKMRQNEWDDTCPPTPRRFVVPMGSHIQDSPSDTNLVTLPYTSATAMKKEGDIIWLESEQIGPTGMELPRINYQSYNGKKYKFMYGVAGFETTSPLLSSVGKVNVTTKQLTRWTGTETQVCSEAIFIADPKGLEEDDGILLSVVVDCDPSSSVKFLLLLDAKSMTEIARVDFPQDEVHICASIHGTFVPN